MKFLLTIIASLVLLGASCATKPELPETESQLDAETEYLADAIVFIKQQEADGKTTIEYPLIGGHFIESSNRIEWIK